MKFINSDVSTIGMGMCASMGAFLLSSGSKGKRFVLPNTEVMIHQPLGGVKGQATEIKIAAEHILKTKDKLNRIPLLPQEALRDQRVLPVVLTVSR